MSSADCRQGLHAEYHHNHLHAALRLHMLSGWQPSSLGDLRRETQSVCVILCSVCLSVTNTAGLPHHAASALLRLRPRLSSPVVVCRVRLYTNADEDNSPHH